MYADVEALLVGWLGAQLTVRTCTELPADLTGALPVVQVDRIGGADRDVSLDIATVDVDCYALGRLAAAQLAARARTALLHALPGTTAAGGVVVRVQTLSAPASRPYDTTSAVHRCGGSYQLTVQALVLR